MLKDALLAVPLLDGHVITVIKSNNTVVKMNLKGQIVKDLYKGSPIRGLLLQGSGFFVIHRNGTITHIKPQDGLILNAYNFGKNSFYNLAIHLTDNCKVPDEILLIASIVKDDTVYAYNISSQTVKFINIGKVNGPTSVSHGCINGKVVYVVIANEDHFGVHVYNATWSRIAKFGHSGNENGQVNRPFSGVVSDQGQIIVADSYNYRVSMFTLDGQFVKHLILFEGTERPLTVSLRGQHLWVTTDSGRLMRYIL